MNYEQEILTLAHQRATEKNLPYAGALTPQEAFEILKTNPKALLIDVRTQAERELVGRVPGALAVEWAFYPGMVANEHFPQQLVAQLDAQNCDTNSVLIFLCRTGGRSNNAATVAARLGFKQVYNMLEGFEGEANSQQQRTFINGWKHAGLPWVN